VLERVGGWPASWQTRRCELADGTAWWTCEFVDANFSSRFGHLDKMTITLRTACTQQYMGHTGAVSKWSRGWQGSMAGFDMSVRTMVETILMVRGDQWTRPGVNQEPAAEAGGGCLRLAPLPPRQMLHKAARGRSACR
jgi:hypothetical protein